MRVEKLHACGLVLISVQFGRIIAVVAGACPGPSIVHWSSIVLMELAV